MSQLSAPMSAALAGDRPLLFGSVEINLPGHDLLLLDGAGEVMIGGRKFVGRDGVYGTIQSIGKLKDDAGDSAPTVTLSLLAASDTALVSLAGANMQGSSVYFRMAVLDRPTGTVVPDPYILFTGELDVPTVRWGQNTRIVDFKITSVFERFFQVEEGKRLAPSFHRSIWPGESGMDGVTYVEVPVPWGQNLPNPWVQTRTNNPAIGISTGSKT